LPHHRTCRSAYGGSSRARKASVLVGEANETHPLHLGHRVGGNHRHRPGVPPGATTVAGCGSCMMVILTAFAELLVPSPWTLPLAPPSGAQLPSSPLIQFVEDPTHFGQAVIRDPTP